MRNSLSFIQYKIVIFLEEKSHKHTHTHKEKIKRFQMRSILAVNRSYITSLTFMIAGKSLEFRTLVYTLESNVRIKYRDIQQKWQTIKAHFTYLYWD